MEIDLKALKGGERAQGGRLPHASIADPDLRPVIRKRRTPCLPSLTSAPRGFDR